MKKLAVVLLSLLMVTGLVACSGNTEQTGQSSTQPSTESISTAGTADNESTAPTDSDSTSDNEEESLKVLVAYFSATNTTEGVAEHIANGLNGDIYEIIPETPYTDADLNYNDNNSRSTVEMNNPNARPAISGSVENMAQYDVVFLGFPKLVVYSTDGSFLIY